MAEIDFDELDQAVNSLMKKNGTTPIGTAPADTPVESPSVTERQPETVPDETTPTDRAEVDDAPDSQATTSTPTVAPTRRRGQFMDVMHPSADMRKSTPTLDTVRRRTIVQPTREFSESNETDDAPATPPSLAPDAMLDQDANNDSSAWSDAVDLPTPPNDQSNDRSKPPLQLSDGLIAGEKALPDGSHDTPTNTPLTPFLSGAKVEKRPLGGLHVESGSDSMSEDKDIDDLAEAIDSTEPEMQPEPVSTPGLTSSSNSSMPAELSRDIMSVEAVDAAAQPSTVDTPEEPEQLDKPAQPERPDEPQRPSTETEPTPASNGPESIAPQYKTSQAAHDEPEHASMYASGHQDLASPAKKKSGWLVPIIILCLLIAGSIGGYLLYTLNFFG